MVIFIILYVAGAILTARHLAYQTKLRNENSLFLGKPLEPKLYSKQDYRDLFSYCGERFNRSDYKDIAWGALLFPVYWTWTLTRTLVSVTLTAGLKKTPGELQQERDERQRELAALKLEIQRVEEETERLRREQDNP